jgi:chaperonin GroES
MSLVDQGMKVFTAIYKRVYDSLSFEFRNLYRLNRKYLTDEAYSAYLGYPASVQADFADDGCLVTPVADPNSVTMMQRMAQAGFLKDLANDPIFGPMLNKGNILQRVLAAANIDDVQSLILPPPPPTPADQIPLMKAMADIDKTKSEAAHNFALASRENSQGEHFQAKTADLITGHLPDFFNNPPTQ